MAARQPGLVNETKSGNAFSVKGKSAIVTGAGSGINFSFAALLLSHGCSVLIADLSLRPEAEQLVKEYGIQEQGRPRAVFLKTNVTDWPQLERMFEVGIQEFGKVDIVCPGAGVYDPHWSNFWHPPGVDGSESRDKADGGRYATLDINVTHPIRTTQLAISHFLNPPPGVDRVSAQNPKRVLIISSIAGQNPNLHAPIYTAAKHGMNGFVRSLGRLEAEMNIRVNAVAPGVIKTPLWTEHPEKLAFVDEAKDAWATPEEVAIAMLRCLEETDLGGGTILEVGAKQTRLVEAYNDPGPSGAGHTVSNLEEQYKEVYGWLNQDGWGKTTGKAKL